MTSLFRGTIHDRSARKRYRTKKFEKWKRKLRVSMDISKSNETLPALLERVRLLRASSRTLFDDARLQGTLRDLVTSLRWVLDGKPGSAAEHLSGTLFTANYRLKMGGVHPPLVTTTPPAMIIISLMTGLKQLSLSSIVSLRVYKFRGRKAPKRRYLTTLQVGNNQKKIGGSHTF